MLLKIIRTIIFVALFFLCIPITLIAETSGNYQILIINSYHEGSLWTDNLNKGIKNILGTYRNPGFNLFIEYMDARRFNTVKCNSNFKKFILQKYNNYKFDAVIVTDNDAFDFIKSIYNEFFYGIPVIFCGVNNFEKSMIDGFPKFTGVNEEIDVYQTLTAALKMHPNLRKINVFCETQTITGRKNFETLNKARGKIFTNAIFEIDSNLSIETALQKVSAMNPASEIILLLTFFKNQYGRLIEFEKTPGILLSVNKIPIYGQWDFFIGYGIIGGMITDGTLHGEATARKCVECLSTQTITEVESCPAKYIFDYNMLKKFNIPLKLLPEKVTIINKESTKIEKLMDIIIANIFIILLLLLIIYILYGNIKTSRKYAASLNESRNKLENANAYHRTLFDACPEPLFRIDLNGRIKDINNQGESFIGISRDKIIGADLTSFLKHKTSIFSLIGKEQSMENINDFIIEVAGADRNNYKTLISFSEYKNEKGEMDGYIIVLKNITILDELQTRLIQSERLSTVGRLAAGVAHEFSNILAIIKLSAKSLQFENAINKLTVDEVNSLNIILKQTDYGSEIVGNMLNFAQPKLSKKQICFIENIIENVLSVQSSFLQTENITIERDYSFNRRVMVDIAQMQQVFLNLCINASQAIKPIGAGMIIVSVKDEIGYLKITFKDNGVGIDKNEIQNIFLPFYTTKSGFAKNSLNIKGAGLGLSVVQQIISKHNGSISVESELQNGATFIIKLPHNA